LLTGEGLLAHLELLHKVRESALHQVVAAAAVDRLGCFEGFCGDLHETLVDALFRV